MFIEILVSSQLFCLRFHSLSFLILQMLVGLIGWQPVGSEFVLILLRFSGLFFYLYFRRCRSSLRLWYISYLCLGLLLLISVVVIIVIVVVVVATSLRKAPTTSTTVVRGEAPASPPRVKLPILLLALLPIEVLLHEVVFEFLPLYHIFIVLWIKHGLEGVSMHYLLDLGWVIRLLPLFLGGVRWLFFLL